MNRTFAASTLSLLLGALSTPALAQFPYGAGAAGSGGLTPSLSCKQPWVGRSTFTIDIGSGRGGSSGFLLMGVGDDNSTYGGLPLYVDLTSFVASRFVALGGAPGVPGAGQLAVPVPLTSVSPAFIGFDIYAQAALLDPAGPGFGGGWTATNGLLVELTATPQVFVASSVANSYFDPFWAVNGLSQTIAFSGWTDDANGAAYTSDGQDLYVSLRGGGLTHADLSSGTPVWSGLFPSSIATTGAFDNCVIDRERQLLWTIGRVVGSVELLGIDIDEGGATYGQVVCMTTWLGGSPLLGGLPIGAWGMSNSRKFVAVARLFGGSLFLVDTDPASATFMQLLSSSPIPPSSQNGWPSANIRIRFSPDDVECYVAMQDVLQQAPGEIARFRVPAGIWVDHNPGTGAVDHIGPRASPPVSFGIGMTGLDVGRDGSLYVAGSLHPGGGAGSTGFAGRVVVAGSAATFTLLNNTSSLGSARNIALNRDQDVLAVAVSNPTTTILFFDAATLSEIGARGLGQTVETTVLVWR